MRTSNWNWRADIQAGFVVFLIALPLCLGISMASGFPPTAGIVTAVVGGLVSTFLGSARLTIKGPAAGLIVIALGAVGELGAGDMALGYRRTLAVVICAGALQVALALSRAGVLGELMPSAVVHGMLAAIGVIIISKQSHVMLGVSPEGKEPLELIAEIPRSLLGLNPEVALIGLLSLAILFGLPLAREGSWPRRIPGPMLVLLVAIPLARWFDLAHEHHYEIFHHDYAVGPDFLIRLPDSLAGVLSYPDFSALASAASFKYVIMFTLVGAIESLLSVTAVDALDPQRRASDLNRDLFAVGAGNIVAGAVGGLPMISEIVRSKANIDNGATGRAANFFHGAFLLGSLALIPGVLSQIPLAALAAMLIYTGFRLASPNEFRHAYRIGPEQLLLFVVTMLVTLASDLLLGVAAGLALKLALHLRAGAPWRSLFRAAIREHRSGDMVTLTVSDAAVFTNYLSLRDRLATVGPDVRRVVVDFRRCWVVDHTVLAKLDRLAKDRPEWKLTITGLDGHRSMSAHQLAARRKVRADA